MSAGYLDTLVPESARVDRRLRERTVAIARRRLDAAMTRWARLAKATDTTARRRISAARAVAASILTAVDRRDPRLLLALGEFRCWLSAVEGALAIALVAARCAAVEPGRRRAAASWRALIDLVTREGLLARLAPGGRVPERFPETALSQAARSLERLAWDAHRIGLAFAGRRALVALGRSSLRFAEDIERGRDGTSARFLGASWRLRAGRRHGAGASLELTPEAVVFRGESLPYPSPEAAVRGGPEVGALLVSRGLDISVGPAQPLFERRVAGALDLLAAAWPAGALMVRDRTWCVVPVAEWAVVSYSSPAKPGISYIQVGSRPLVRLAEDLVHEAAHMRLHEIESVHDLLHPDAEAEDGPRFYSPWRREWRPLRGLLHACYTFTVGASFFERMLAASERSAGPVRFPAARRSWLARRLLEETAMVAIALPALRSADRRGLLRPAGRRFVEAIAREQKRLHPEAERRRRLLRRSTAGRAELARVERLTHRLGLHPVRWTWEAAPDEP